MRETSERTTASCEGCMGGEGRREGLNLVAGRVSQTPDGHQHSSCLHLGLSRSQPGLLSGAHDSMENTHVQRAVQRAGHKVSEAESKARVVRLFPCILEDSKGCFNSFPRYGKCR